MNEDRLKALSDILLAGERMRNKLKRLQDLLLCCEHDVEGDGLRVEWNTREARISLDLEYIPTEVRHRFIQQINLALLQLQTDVQQDYDEL